MPSITFVDGVTIAPASWLNDVNDFVFAGILPPSLIVSVGNGGTSANNAADARTNLGLQIGVDVQAYDAFLSTLSGLSSGIVVKTPGSAVSRTITGTANKITVTNGDGVSGNPTLTVGSDVYQVGGTDVAVLDGGTGASTGSQALINLGANIFSTIAVSGQSDVVADSPTDTLTLVAGSNVTITTNAGTDTITIAATGGGGSPGGSNTQVQYNNAGAFGGISGLTTNGTDVTASSGNLKLSGATSGTTTLNAAAIAGTTTLTLQGTTGTIYSSGGTANDNLDALQGVADAADALPYFTGTAAMTVTTLTAAARTVLDDATVSAMVDTLGGASSTGSGGLARATSPTFVTPILGTPTSGTLTNCTLPVGGLTGLGANVGTFLATPSSANLAAALTDETGSGAAVFATSPTLTTPNIGTPSAGTLTNCTGLPVAGGGTGVATMTTAYAPVCAGTTATGALQVASTGLGNTGYVLTSNGASALPSFQAVGASSTDLGKVYTMAYGIITL